ncbi:MAG: capsid assembly protein, partial [Prevotella nanceiensis]|nr:capsid assembly protein [Hoylesella nanceiensis]
MEEKIVFDQENKEEKGNSLLNLQALTTSLFLNWKWIVFSVLICLGLAQAYLRYTTPIYRVSAKMLIKEEERTRTSRNALQSATNLGTISNSTGLFNEIEIIKSHDLAEAAVRDLKLYVNYNTDGRIKNLILYGNQPINVDIDPANLDRLSSPISLAITRQGNNYHVKGSFSLPIGTEKESGPYSIDKVLTKLPQTINTRAGVLSFRRNGIYSLNDGATMFVTIQSPSVAAYKYAGALTITPNNNTTTIAQITLTDENPQRAKDYLVQLINVYNRQANEDKNEIARNTEEFINSRLEKINAELGATEGALENFKKRNRIVQIDMNAGQAMGNADNYEQKLTEANTQVSLLNSISDYMNQSGNKYQTLPSNVGLTDQSTTELINKYNELVLERNRRLGSASETSPVVTSITTQLDELNGSIRRAMSQARKSMEIQRNSIASQFGRYQGQISATPEQERIMTQIGRQQDVKSGLYLMLLQKREENSISLAATADKGRLVDAPSSMGKISPKNNIVFIIALVIGLAIPTLIIMLLQLLNYKIEGHNDVEKLTSLPILADVAVANDIAKTRGDIVVHENQNNQMEEIFRSIRTNLQFMLKENEKVVMFTSTTSGEGKTFNAANLAVSFALLNKKVILIGLDIRKPRIAELFEIDNHTNGITNVLV